MRSTVLHAWQRSEEPAGRALSVTETTQFSEALDRALAQSIDRHLKDRARVRDLFLAMLGHDLRAPLSGIQMAAHVLGHPALEEAGRHQAALRIRRALQQMDHLITDLIDFTRSRLGHREGLVRPGFTCQRRARRRPFQFSGARVSG